jgi:GxxExxY protein
MNENQISYLIIGAAIELHRNLGPGLLESAYESALIYELNRQNLDVKSQVPMPMIYKDIRLDNGYRLDLIANDLVIVEIKAIENLAPVHFAQTLTYLKLSQKKLGLLINFNNKVLKDGIHRIVHQL